MDDELNPPVLSSRHKGFWFGFILSLSACTLAACVGLICSGKLGEVARAVPEPAPAPARPSPPAVDEAGARARLNKAAGFALAYPFPDPQIMLNKAYGEIDLFYGERFVKRYRVEGAGGMAAGCYAVVAHEPPESGAPLRIGLAGCEPTSATSTVRLHAGSLAAGAGRLEIAGVKGSGNPAAAGAGTAASGGAGATGGAGELRLSEGEAAEIYTATEAGDLVVVVEQ